MSTALKKMAEGFGGGGGGAATGAISHEFADASRQYTDIAVNLTDTMYKGQYQGGKQAHPADVENVLTRAALAGVTRIIITGTDLEESRKALALARTINASGAYPTLKLYSTVGLHPTSTSALQGPPEAYEAALLEVARDGMADKTVVFIGECGLDFERFHFSPEPTQREHFPMHMRLARATGLPLFLHDRATHGALLELMAAHGGVPPAGGVVHSFTGTSAELAAILAAPGGLLVGLNGCGLKTEENCAVAASIPLDRLLLETDAPWCGIKASSPAFKHVKTVGRAVKKEKWEASAMVKDRNEPANVVQVAEVAAALRDTTPEVVAEACEANLRRLLGGFL
jgi:TatD DNase family protein